MALPFFMSGQAGAWATAQGFQAEVPALDLIVPWHSARNGKGPDHGCLCRECGLPG